MVPQPQSETAVWVATRADAAAHEVRDIDGSKPFRPWLVVSQNFLHAQGMFLGPPARAARNPTDLCVRAKPGEVTDKQTNLDCQQVWTIANTRLSVTEPPFPRAARHIVSSVRGRLDEYFAFATGTRGGWLCQGRVVWIRLEPASLEVEAQPGSGTRPPRTVRFSDASSDVGDWRRTMKLLTSCDPGDPSSWLLPAMVISHDDYLPRHSKTDRRRGVFPLATVIPLVTSKKLLALGLPTVSHPRMHSFKYAVLVPYLLSLDYTALTEGGAPRLMPSRVGFENWIVSDEVRHTALRAVRQVLLLPPLA